MTSTININFEINPIDMKKVKEIKTFGWLYLENSSAKENKKEIELEIDKPNHGNIGKYMFFSDDKKLLIKTAKEILTKYNLFQQKSHY